MYAIRSYYGREGDGHGSGVGLWRHSPWVEAVEIAGEVTDQIVGRSGKPVRELLFGQFLVLCDQRPAQPHEPRGRHQGDGQKQSHEMARPGKPGGASYNFV